MIGVILAGGDGTRLKMSTGQDTCKSLRIINDKHLIEFALNNLIELEATDVYIVVGKQGDLVKSAIGDKYKSLTVHYVHQPQQKGLVNAFVHALTAMNCDETVVLQLCDEIFVDLKVESIKNVIKTGEFDFYCGVTLEENEEKIKNNFSVETKSDSSIIKCTEKPKVVIDNIKGTGFSIFNGKTHKIIKDVYESNTHNIHDLCDCFNYLVSLNCRGSAFFVAEKEFNINTVSDLTEAERFLNI